MRDTLTWHVAVTATGAGKTTLAHVVARHCRFRPVEINASDERTASTLVRRVEDAAQMRAVLDKAQRPNCIILDEVDGATGGSEGHSAVAALVALVTRGRDRQGGKTAAAVDGGKEGQRLGGIVARSLIAYGTDQVDEAVMRDNHAGRTMMTTPVVPLHGV